MIEDLKSGDTLKNRELCDMFLCSPQGGMRRSTRTNTLVIVSNHVRSIYDDRWENDIIHYTGMGVSGDQNLNWSQNKTLAQSPSIGIDVHLFEVFVDKEYIYTGTVKLVGNPYEEVQPDEAGNLRKVWMFPLKITRGKRPEIPDSVIQINRSRRERMAKELSDSELKKRAKCASRRPSTSVSSVKRHERSEWVSEYSKRWAEGVCQLCGEPAPFLDKDGAPFLESHHINWLSRDGEDSIENVVALCPNCHRRVHALDKDSDRSKMLQNLSEHLAE